LSEEDEGWNDMYRGTPPWDIGRPQREFVALQERGEVRGDVIDLGCGTGENAIFFASEGHAVLGLDFTPLAIKQARAKAKRRGVKVEFAVYDALRLGELGRTFQTATDCGLFHTFTDGQREAYVDGLRSVVAPSGRFFMLCFSDREPRGWGGPRRVSKGEIERAFRDGWRLDYVHPARFDSRFHDDGGLAWLASATRLGQRGQD
jgi:SAM-dependent methyltransferase